jgi:hypothetical protein
VIRDDIREAANRSDRDRASELMMVLQHFLETPNSVAASKRAGL